MKTFRAYDHTNNCMVYSNEPDAKFTFADGDWSVNYVRERNIVSGEVESDEPRPVFSDILDIMLSTGKQDSTGREIYDGDIVSNKYTTYTVLPNGWLENEQFIRQEWSGYNFKVVGNIHEPLKQTV